MAFFLYLDMFQCSSGSGSADVFQITMSAHVIVLHRWGVAENRATTNEGHNHRTNTASNKETSYGDNTTTQRLLGHPKGHQVQ